MDWVNGDQLNPVAWGEGADGFAALATPLAPTAGAAAASAGSLAAGSPDSVGDAEGGTSTGIAGSLVEGTAVDSAPAPFWLQPSSTRSTANRGAHGRMSGDDITPLRYGHSLPAGKGPSAG